MTIRATAAALLVLVVIAIAGCVEVRTGRTPRPANSGAPKTVLAGFGKTDPFESFESAERRLGWRVMRPSDPRFELVRQGGLLRTRTEVGVSRVEQAYALGGRRTLIDIVQGPESWEFSLKGEPSEVVIGTYNGTLWGVLPDNASFVFPSGEQAAGQRILVHVVSFKGTDWSESDVRNFIASLSFDEPAR